jgi:translation initiation factor 1
VCRASVVTLSRASGCYHPPMTTRIVYSTDKGRVCPGCGWPADDCRCAVAADEPVPAKITAILRLEAKGRGGKRVTVIDGLPANGPFLTEVAHALKRSCATGGTVRAGAIELAGDVRQRVRPLLKARGITVKG